ncbi:helix-turn-helix transcriptional regulator [Streptomyces sp. B22F1]|uniref:helix-turn-helix domain-containing protein n=1 Tax=Streptomyces sp. B22F1 TaxID=3153566 RepID=UPI00325C3718
MNHSRWKLARERKLAQGYAEPPEVVAERELIRLCLTLGQAVHDRRETLGLSESELAERLGISVDELEGVELGDPDSFRPTLLARLAQALEADVDLHLTVGGGTAVSFHARAA